MDAREVIRHFLQGTDLSCDDLITALEWHGNRILHRDENHGPTLERAAEELRSMIPILPPDGPATSMQEVEYTSLGHALLAIRAMEVKHDA